MHHKTQVCGREGGGLTTNVDVNAAATRGPCSTPSLHLVGAVGFSRVGSPM